MSNNEISLNELYLPLDASSVMDYNDAAIEVHGNTLVVGYLSDDQDCPHPLNDCDGMGKIYSAHRDSSKEEHGKMQEALGLDRDWEPDFELDAVAAENRLRELVKRDFGAEFATYILTCTNEGLSLKRAWENLVEDFKYASRVDYALTQQVLDAGHSWDDLLKQAWDAGRANGTIGDVDAVSLDCYQHGGTSWSVSGQGMQCQFDTARGAGIWVPDDCARDEINRRAPVYQKGRISDNNGVRGNQKFYVRTFRATAAGVELSDTVHPVFEEWHQAFQYLGALDVAVTSDAASGRYAAAFELARQACDVYTAWLGGDCYGYVVATFENIAEAGDDPEWEFVASDECWGFIGSEYAMEEAQSGVEHEIKRLKAEAEILKVEVIQASLAPVYLQTI